MDLVEEVYCLTTRLPARERSALTDQLRRSAVSVAANIAEGHSRVHRKEFLHLLSIARGSLMELETHLLILERVGYQTESEVSRALGLADEVSRMLTRMRARLAHPPPHPTARPATLDAQPAQ